MCSLVLHNNLLSSIIISHLKRVKGIRTLVEPGDKIIIELIVRHNAIVLDVDVQSVKRSKIGDKGWRARSLGKVINESDWQNLFKLPLRKKHRIALTLLHKNKNRPMALNDFDFTGFNSMMSSTRQPYRIRQNEKYEQLLICVATS